MSKYEHIKNTNSIYLDFIKCNTTDFFNEIMVATLMAKESDYVDNALRYVKFIKDETSNLGYGLKVCKEWYDILSDLGFIINKHSNFQIKDEIKEINSMDDIVFIVENDLNIKQYLRIKKLEKLTNKINKNG